MKTLGKVLLLAVLVSAVPAPALAGTWVQQNCDGTGRRLTTWKRSQASAYAQPMLNEGYEWDGGCYRNNDKDDTPSLPTDAGGEGADCSGFVFRVWGLRKDGSSDFRYWEYDKNIHGPYYTWDYYDPLKSEPFRLIGKSYDATTPMDAFVYYRPDERHVALIQQEADDGWDYVVHARNNTDGTLLNLMPYRSYSDSRAVMREKWTLECHPKCPTT